MSNLGYSTPPPGPQRPAPTRSSTVPLWAILLVLVLVVAGGGFAARSLLQSSKQHGPTYPAAWDKRIAPYAKIAEKKRGLLFLHPVAVRFLPPAKFEKTVTTDDKDLDEQDRTDLKQFTGLMRAFGLLSGDVDLFKSVNDFNGAGVLAYYSFEDKRITIRGSRITPSIRATLVHELTHVLQDQHFDIGDRMKKLNKESEKGESTTESSVLDSIIEGDAERIESSYQASLPPKQRKAVEKSQQTETKQATKRISKVPKVVVTMLTSAYTLGESLVQAVAADGGNKAVDKLFQHAPKHESSLLDPFTVIAHDTGAKTLEVPELERGEKKFDSGELGVLTWYFMLAERLPLRDALAAADGWGGDAYVAFERDGHACARLDYAGKTSADTTRMYVDLKRWAAAAPGSPAHVARHGTLVRLDSCDPGTTARGGKDSSAKAVELVMTRTYAGVNIMKAGARIKVARCIAGRLVDNYSVAQLVDPTFATKDPAERAGVQRLALGCRT
jgi:hypothetical protein